jgi:hypothetical protein
MHRAGGCLNQFKNPFQKKHALAESLLSRVFSWDVVDVGFPTCLKQPALPSEAPQTKQIQNKFKKIKIINSKSQINQK